MYALRATLCVWVCLLVYLYIICVYMSVWKMWIFDSKRITYNSPWNIGCHSGKICRRKIREKWYSSFIQPKMLARRGKGMPNIKCAPSHKYINEIALTLILVHMRSFEQFIQLVSSVDGVENVGWRVWFGVRASHRRCHVYVTHLLCTDFRTLFERIINSDSHSQSRTVEEMTWERICHQRNEVNTRHSRHTHTQK